MAVSGISTLGITLAYAETTDGTKPSTGYKTLTRINSIGEVTVEPENIDASALEDLTTKNIAGRSTVSDSIEIVVNFTSDTETEWSAILGKTVCFEVIIPEQAKAFFTIAQVPAKIPQPSLDQNGLLTFTMNCTVNDFIGLDTKVEPTTV